MLFKWIFWISLSLIVYSYLGFYLVLFILTKIKPKKRLRDQNYFPTISMLISAYNEESVIKSKIDNCLLIDYPKDKIEFLFGSDASDDNTNQILTANQSNLIRPFFYSQRQGKAATLNRLVKNADGEILVFSDANTMYQPDAIKNLVQHFVDENIGGVCGRLKLVSFNDSSGGNGETLYWSYENMLKAMEGKIKTVFGANGAIYAIRHKFYHALPENKVIMDDFIIPLKIIEKYHKDIIYASDAVGIETTSKNEAGEFTRKIRIGAANFNSLVEIWRLLLPWRCFVAFGLWSHKILRWFVPFFLIFVLVTNFLLSDIPFFMFAALLQLLFYMSSLIGFMLTKLEIKKPSILVYSYYFVGINAALLIGFFKFIFKTQKPAWKRVQR
ncbi:MAG: glycosyltransferase family 2 protein [Candidatus Zhuqueibacterota bacterium]